MEIEILAQLLIPVSNLLRNVVKADGYEEEINEMTFNSYIVVLRDIDIKEVDNKQVKYIGKAAY